MQNIFTAKTYVDRGAEIAREGRVDEAIELFHQALQYWPDQPEAHFYLGHAAYVQCRFEDSLPHFRRAIRIFPDFVEAHYSLAVSLLLLGRFEEGWAEHEWRLWRASERSTWYPGYSRWNGSRLDGRTILVQAEQGLGDSIQFLRYARLVKQMGGTVILGCSPALVALASSCAGIDRVVSWGQNIDAFDSYVALMSLPHLLGTSSLSTIPASSPYLQADPACAHQWRSRLAGDQKLKVGLVWQGYIGNTADDRRSAPLSQFAPLARVPNVSLYSLQIGPGSEQLAVAEFPIINLAPSPLSDLAAVLVSLDLLITVDTAPAHLAGALGVPVWIALPKLPDWRWLLDRSDSPWYPTARLFRQTEPGNWQPVFDQMAQALKQLVHHR